MTPAQIKRSFLTQATAETFCDLFEQIPETYFWVKDLKGRYIANSSSSVFRKHRRIESDIIGRTDEEFFPPEMVEEFNKDDQEVILKKKKIIGKVEKLSSEGGQSEWHVTTKIPVLNNEGNVIGTAGLTYNLSRDESKLERQNNLSEVLHYIALNYSKKVEVGQLADMMEMSIGRFERHFKKTFGITPIKYLIQVRNEAGKKMLLEGDNPVSEIADKVGYCNTGAFSLSFKKQFGVSPQMYRKQNT
jgi:AraC-like DNA-binding protein